MHARIFNKMSLNKLEYSNLQELIIKISQQN